jgi:hypothetical protein
MGPRNHEHPVCRNGVIDYDFYRAYATELRREARRTALPKLWKLITATASRPRQMGDSDIANISAAPHRVAG